MYYVGRQMNRRQMFRFLLSRKAYQEVLTMLKRTVQQINSDVNKYIVTNLVKFLVNLQL